mmetsp:Transcript_56997/g.135594  ORF Transcript_56997/g.135594 Transcript_56997/m.135594 type:complete len:231 (-) Transcript_56997:1046-1738(-)
MARTQRLSAATLIGKAHIGNPFLSICSLSARRASKCLRDDVASLPSSDSWITVLERKTARHSVTACTVAVLRLSKPNTATSPMTAPSDKVPTTRPDLHLTSASPRRSTIMESATSPACARISPASNLTSQRFVQMWSITSLEKPANTGLLLSIGSVTDLNHKCLRLTDSVLCCLRDVKVSASGCPPLGSCSTAALMQEPLSRAQRTKLPSQALTEAVVCVTTPRAPASPK